MPVGDMALLLFTGNPASTPLFSLSSSSIRSAITAHPLCRSCNNLVCLKPKSNVGYRTLTSFILKERGVLIVKASSDVDGVGSNDPESPASPSESNEENVPIENLPLESKLQLKLEQKMRMKAAKKIRLRRKRLVRKRHLRKKGRWPPSKLKKNKNV
ncbi:50S ribosomal protein 5 alpha, chloroplastic-like [Olea europaea var. sylvestris]|uniref:50S ribosomal protein 5, chloroplastic n=2 Tax=Olea europaea subsp. europaea TaxID=158383 RepID=A0A8S0TT46_OLEEU|nr:50S ribosomal protein 5 alpha, chloroplastic-like [Olea europaea var. sylvestris]CAA3008153.1 Hypothetical predicted protein [Olea europaea subsp. europaea]